ncbi:MAG: SMP-30/gluconolactonase/LRE family protein [Alphaproteobacteria bacterium]|nr:SMP-30/gluconolactonase/LRE family protein [Alphaproteobacteria bacterium]
MTVAVFDATPCSLGEGPLWHPERGQLFWFDINRHRLHSRAGGETLTWQFDEHVSAAGWLDEVHLLVASETRLFRFNVDTGAREDIAALEADDPVTRSNDGRADPWGGFWIGTMGKGAEPGAGAIYRYYRGEVRRLYHPITISNAICFSPDRAFAYYTDTPTQKIMRQALDQTDGWPVGAPELWLDLGPEGWRPDGAVVDAEANFWNAQWGGYRVACYDPDGQFLRAVAFPAAQTSCPAFGGDDLTTLFCTSARAGLSADQLAAEPTTGGTFAAAGIAKGQAEHRVIL